jgi:hypothetical protein
MAISEDRRHEMYEGLIEALGRERATTLMEHLPPVGWADVATKRDLDQQTLVLRRDMEAEFGKVRAEIASVRAELGAEIASVRTEIAAAEARFERALREQTRLFFLGLLASNATFATLAFAAARLV